MFNKIISIGIKNFNTYFKKIKFNLKLLLFCLTKYISLSFNLIKVFKYASIIL